MPHTQSRAQTPDSGYILPCQGWKEKPSQGEELRGHASRRYKSPAAKARMTLNRFPPKIFIWPPNHTPNTTSDEPSTRLALCQALVGLLYAELFVEKQVASAQRGDL